MKQMQQKRPFPEIPLTHRVIRMRCERGALYKEREMGAREFELKQGAVLKIDALAGDRLRVRAGDVWITQHEDSKDYILRTGQSMTLSGKGATLAMAYKP